MVTSKSTRSAFSFYSNLIDAVTFSKTLKKIYKILSSYKTGSDGFCSRKKRLNLREIKQIMLFYASSFCILLSW